MHPHYRLLPRDREFYEKNLKGFLPKRFFDAHMHIARPEVFRPISEARLKGDWAIETAHTLTFEEAELGYRELFPDSRITPMAFPFPIREADIAQSNRDLAGLVREGKILALMGIEPHWHEDTIRKGLTEDGFVGIKPYPDLANEVKRAEISVFEFLPRRQLAVLNELGGLLMLHLPRKGRIADPSNLDEMDTIRREFPRVKMIIAHLGRAFCPIYLEKALDRIQADEGYWFDTSAVLNPDTFRLAFREISPKRILFGTDFPILYLRGRREWTETDYINLSDADYHWNKNRRPPEVEAGYTLFIYESINNLRLAARDTGLKKEDIEDIFHNNLEGMVKDLRRR